MTHALSLALLWFGCGCEVVCVAGLLWFRSGFDQLHFVGAATTVGTAAIAVAVGLTGFSSPSGTIDCIIALGLLFLLGPVTVSMLARYGRRERFGSLEPTRAEFERQPS